MASPILSKPPPYEVAKDYDDCAKLRRDLIEWTRNVLDFAAANNNSNEESPPPELPMRKLNESELRTLKENGCRFLASKRNKQQQEDDADVGDPSTSVRLLLSPSQLHRDQSSVLKRYVSTTTFQGTVVLVLDDDIGGAAVADQQHELVAKGGSNEDGLLTDEVEYDGIHSNARIGDGCILHVRSTSVCGNGFLSRTYVGPRAVVRNCGHVACNKGSDWTSHLELEVGPESGGGRKLTATPESDLVELCRQLVSRESAEPPVSHNGDPPLLNILCSHSQVVDTPTVTNVFAYPNACVRAATSVERCLLYPNSAIRNSSICRDVLMQWNSRIADSSVVSNAFVMEQSEAGPNSTVNHVVLGPDVHVSCGEVHASVLGPNTNAHHQSLVIGLLWPLGRGNVAYGANVGSNHTGRLPDQETVGGEGTFWGLSTVIKFPVSLQDAPYTVVAAGTVLPPQTLRMPFSLVVTSTSDGNRNSILPGWVLQSSPYTIARNQAKFARRRKAKRHLHYTGWDIIRPATVELCRKARKALLLEGMEIPGIGPNELSEKARNNGIAAYTGCIQRFVLQGLLTCLSCENSKDGPKSWTLKELSSLLLVPAESSSEIEGEKDATKAEWQPFPWEADESNTLWNYQRALLLDEFPPPATATTNILPWLRDVLLDRLVLLEHEYAFQVYESKRRDDTRGEQTVPGYADAHVAADEDPVVLQVRSDAEETERKVKDLLVKLEP